MFEKVEKPTRVYQLVARRLEDAIVFGMLKTGEKLPSERELSKTFGISQRTLRESLRVLEEKGLIETSQTGNTVKAISHDRMSNSLTILIKSHKITWKQMYEIRRDLDLLITVANQIEGNTICALGEAAAWPVKFMVERFRDHFEKRVSKEISLPVANKVHSMRQTAFPLADETI